MSMIRHHGDWAIWQGDLEVHPPLLSNLAVLQGSEDAGGERRVGGA